MAREALALGEMKAWFEALSRLERSFLEERDQIDPEKRNMYQLWIWMMWSKYHQYQGKLLPVRDIMSFESDAQLDVYIRDYEKIKESLEKAVSYLKRYNLLYQQMADQSNTRSLVQLQASLSLERDLSGLIHSVGVYLTLLRLGRLYRKDIRKMKKQLEGSQKDIKKLSDAQEDTAKSKRQIKRNQRKLSVIFQRVDGAYLKFEKERKQRAVGSRGLAIAGAVVMGVGLLTAVGGAIVISDVPRHQASSTDKPWFPVPEDPGLCSVTGKPGCFQGVAEWTGQLNTVSYSLFGAGGGLLLVGGVLLAVGLVGTPSEKEKTRSVLRSQDVYLRTLKPQGNDKTSLRFRYRRSSSVCSTLLEVR